MPGEVQKIRLFSDFAKKLTIYSGPANNAHIQQNGEFGLNEILLQLLSTKPVELMRQNLPYFSKMEGLLFGSHADDLDLSPDEIRVLRLQIFPSFNMFSGQHCHIL
jgi:hypothetical protein